jgi:hypothetical protein
MKVGTKVVILGLHPRRGEIGTYTGRLRAGWLGIKSQHEVTLPSGEVVYTNLIGKVKGKHKHDREQL